MFLHATSSLAPLVCPLSVPASYPLLFPLKQHRPQTFLIVTIQISEIGKKKTRFEARYADDRDDDGSDLDPGFGQEKLWIRIRFGLRYWF